ncbi:MAG: hypothetical protein GX824_04565 [Clostridiales bacterium]|jgi:hypothetical protein|nr:hypothetical protein [Clostridiales bacterium]
MSVSFNGCNEKSVTFIADDELTAGVPVKVSENDTVSACDAGDSFCGICTSVRNGYATVQLGGFAVIPFTGSTDPSVGYCTLAADGSGGVKVTATGGRSLLVVNVDAASDIVGIML